MSQISPVVYRLAPNFPADDENVTILAGLVRDDSVATKFLAGEVLNASILDKINFSVIQEGEFPPLLSNSLGWFLLREDIVRQLERLPITVHLQFLPLPPHALISPARRTVISVQYFYMNLLERIPCIDLTRSDVRYGTNDVGKRYILSVSRASLTLAATRMDLRKVEWLIFRADEYPFPILAGSKVADTFQRLGLGVPTLFGNMNNK